MKQRICLGCTERDERIEALAAAMNLAIEHLRDPEYSDVTRDEALDALCSALAQNYTNYPTHEEDE